MQSREILIYKGEEISMFSEPLNSYLENFGANPFIRRSTACRRGYIGKWLIENDRLYLIELVGRIEGGNEVQLDYLFPSQHKVFAEWFSGELELPQGNELPHNARLIYMLYEGSLFLEINNGLLVNKRSISNLEKTENDSKNDFSNRVINIAKPRLPNRPEYPKEPTLNKNGNMGCVFIGLIVFLLLAYLTYLYGNRFEGFGIYLGPIVLFFCILFIWRTTVWDYESEKKSYPDKVQEYERRLKSFPQEMEEYKVRLEEYNKYVQRYPLKKHEAPPKSQYNIEDDLPF